MNLQNIIFSKKGVNNINIQSLSIVVPNKKCINDCCFCVSKMHCENIPNLIDINNPDFQLHKRDFIKRLNFARDNGCNTVMLTGTSEPQQNKHFLHFFSQINEMLDKPFRWIELQTTGVLLDDNYLTFLRETVGVNVISLSISAFDDVVNQQYTRMPEGAFVDLKSLCKKIKDYGFTLRLSINLTDYFDRYKTIYSVNTTEFFRDITKQFAPDQVTFRLLYSSDDGSEQSKWVSEHSCDKQLVHSIIERIRSFGTPLEKLPYGRIKYSYNGISVVIDDDCMSKSSTEDYKYLILQPNCKLYSRWDDTASLIF